MNHPEPSKYQKIVFWCFLTCGIFAMCLSFLDFLSWSGDTSIKKWEALNICVLCAVFTFLLWRFRDATMELLTANPDAESKMKSAVEQRCHWKAAIRTSIVSAVLALVFFSLILIASGESALPIAYFIPGLLWVMEAGYIVRAKRELAKLRQE